MKCENCGKELLKSDVYCTNCGAHNSNHNKQEILENPSIPIKTKGRDRKQGVYVKDNRNSGLFIILAFITGGFYVLIEVYRIMRDTDKICEYDGKKSPDALVYVLLFMFTGGIAFLIWLAGTVNRLNDYLYMNQKSRMISSSGMILWIILGSMIIVGPFIAYSELIDTINVAARLHNHSISEYRKINNL